MESSAEDIVDCRKDDNASVHDNAIVHFLRCRSDIEREERENIHEDKIAHGTNIDRHAKDAERPAAWWERLSADAFQK